MWEALCISLWMLSQKGDAWCEKVQRDKDNAVGEYF